MIRSALALLASLTACAAQPASIMALEQAGTGIGTGSRDAVVLVPVTGADGAVTPIQTRICRPVSDEPARAVIINHGSPADSAARPRMQLSRCGGEAAQWFLARGYVVVFPLRRGYGANGGVAPEASPSCQDADFAQSGLETARDIDAVVRHVSALPFVRPGQTVVLGQSAGGWGAVAYDSIPHPGVTAIISMAGGRGGHHHFRPNENCHPERLVDAAGRFGATATTPMLWIYTANDSYFAPALAVDMHDAFTRAGGKAEFVQPGPFGSDGHELFFGRGGSAIWGPPVERYLARQEASPH